MRQRRAKIEEAKRIVIGYVRVSTDEQVTNGVSVDAQRARIEAYGVAMGLRISEIIVDAGTSAKTLQRPGMARLLDGVRDGSIGGVVAVKLDRLTRSTRDLSDLLDLFAQSSAALISISESLDTTTAAGRMVVSMLGVVAQWEREAIGERTSAALGHKRYTGRVYGPTPFGFANRDGNLVPDDREQTALALMRDLDASGASFRDIARALEAQGYAARHGGTHWHASSVRSVLRSKATLGVGTAA